MSRYFFDTEFIEGKQDKTFLGIKYGETKPIIDLISIGIVWDKEFEDSDYKELHGYYAISKDFNLKAAWKNEWVRENVCKHLFSHIGYNEVNTFKEFKKLVLHFGKTNKQIAKEIVEFAQEKIQLNSNNTQVLVTRSKPEFYAYYADYDWVVFCQLFGTMMDLPNGFPYYCLDLMQYLHDKAVKLNIADDELKQLPNYPKQVNEHSSIYDAKWNYELYKFLNTL